MFGPTQLPSLRWQAGYRIGRKGKRVTRTFDTYGEAHDWAQQAEAEARAGHATAAATAAVYTPAPTTSTLTVSEHGARWLALKATKAKGTRDGYASHLRAIAATGMGERVMATVTGTQVQEWLNQQDAAGVGRPSINARLKVLRMVFRHARGDLLISHDPCAGVPTLSTDIPQANPLDAPQVLSLLDHATPAQAAMVMLATDAGLRWSEMAGLPVSAVLGDYLLVRQVVERSTGSVRRFTKSTRPRVVPIGTQRLADALAPLVAAARATGDPEALLFTSSSGGPLDYWDWRRDQWRPLCRAAGLNPRPRFHDLRHTFGTDLAAANVPVPEIQKLLGHADQKTTERYIHAGTDGRRLALVRQALGA
jgi:integrase